MTSTEGRLLGASDVRRLAAELDLVPTKKLGQNFVIDPGTVRRIVRTSGVTADSSVIEVGPGLGSLTLALLETGCRVTAIEIDPRLGARLAATIREFMPAAARRISVLIKDAMALTPDDLPDCGQRRDLTLVANLPYNIATPLVLTLLQRFDSIHGFTVMVQKEVADRMVASPGGKAYGAPSAKLAWYGHAERTGIVGRNVFWPMPNVDSALVSFTRERRARDDDMRRRVFEIIDAAFGQRRKTLRHALRGLVSEEGFLQAGIDSGRRGETLGIEEFSALAREAEGDADACDVR